MDLLTLIANKAEKMTIASLVPTEQKPSVIWLDNPQIALNF